jgi:energy-coupling factor transporter ATP-binding protein EcfA2
MQSAGKQETVQLAAGEQASISCDGAIAMVLGVGSVELDGALLAPDATYRFRLSKHRRATVSTLTGGSFVIKSNVNFSVHKAASRVPKLSAVVKSCAGRTNTRVVVVGERRSGKSTAARIILNGLLRAHTGDSDCRVVYLEGDTACGSVCAAGTIAAAEAAPPTLPLESPFLETVPIAFYTGYLHAPEAFVGHLLHTLSQAMQSAEWLVRRGEHRTQHLVVDAPNAPRGTDQRWFVKQLLELVRPTHVVVLGDEDEYDWVMTEMKRLGLADAALQIQPPLVPPELPRDEVTENERSFAEYLCGPPSTSLDCAAVVAPLDALKFVKFAPEIGPSAVVECNPSTVAPGSVVGVSLAQTMEEVGFANIAGLLVVKEIIAAENEAIFYAPDAEMIPRRFIVVGGSTMMCRPHLVAPYAI